MEIWQYDADSAVGVIVEALRQGKVIACPTDTVYGLVADATNDQAVAHIFKIKQRPEQKPVSVFVRSIEDAKNIAVISGAQETYLQSVWPGKTTAVLEGRHILPQGIEYEGKIGIRMPDYQLLKDILHMFERPVTGTSANISGEASCLDSSEVIEQFRSQAYQPDILLDAGRLPESQPSTVIDITSPKHVILRP